MSGIALPLGSGCPRCRLSHNQPELQSCPLCGYEIAKFAALESPGVPRRVALAADQQAGTYSLASGRACNVIAPTVRVYYLSDSLAKQLTWPLLLIRAAIGLALLAAVLRAGVQATGSVPYMPRSMPAVTLTR
jgi:hypothetical protein